MGNGQADPPDFRPHVLRVESAMELPTTWVPGAGGAAMISRPGDTSLGRPTPSRTTCPWPQHLCATENRAIGAIKKGLRNTPLARSDSALGSLRHATLIDTG
jgi:hypothetical protein